MKFSRVQITGPSGTGKTTLAKIISDELNIPFISTSAKEVWPNFGINKHSDVFDLSIPKFKEYQEAINDNRVTNLHGINSFISDRSVGIDSIAYFFDHLAGRLSKVELDIFKSEVITDMLSVTDAIIYLPYNFDLQSIPINDGKRITNQYYQEKMTLIFDYVINMLSDRKLKPNWKHTTILEGKIEIIRLCSWDINKKSIKSIKFIKNGASWSIKNS